MERCQVYDWDYGSYFIKPLFETASSHPHAIKLVSTDASDDYVGGKYYLTWYQSLTTKFIIVNPPVADTSTTSSYYVYTTDGVVERVIVDVAGEGQMTTRGIELISRHKHLQLTALKSALTGDSPCDNLPVFRPGDCS